MLEGRVRIPLTALCLSCRCDLRAAATRRLDLRSASDARDTKTARLGRFPKGRAHPQGAVNSRYTKTPASQATRNFGYQRYDATRTFAIILGMDRQLIYPEECYSIRGAIYEVYRELGNGFREEVYQQQAWSARQFRRISQSRCRAVGELTSQFSCFSCAAKAVFVSCARRRPKVEAMRRKPNACGRSFAS